MKTFINIIVTSNNNLHERKSGAEWKEPFLLFIVKTFLGVFLDENGGL